MPKAKMLPVFLLLDVSGSMSLDNKMHELNKSVKEMIETFKHEQAVQAEIFVSIITFGNKAEMISDLKSACEIEYADLIAGGVTCMGNAFDMAKGIIEDGADADVAMMKRFLDHPEKEVCYVEDAADIHKFFRFISSSTVQRSKSATPNVVPAELMNADILNLNFD